ncbi:GIY-YIG nuclease family protein [Streptomyces tendae]|uniref:GIY-YIG nuclease family protein n=1 Tax=Streptomyces tendae TaxID=1932 RepID=UPI0036BB2B20
MNCLICGSPNGRAWGSYGPTPACEPCHSDVVSQQRTALSGKPTCLYRLYDVFGRLLYAGITADLARRWKEHRSEHREWWYQVTERRVQWFPSRGLAWRAERQAVRAELPLYNNESWGDFTGGRRPELPSGVPPRPDPPTGEDQVAVDAYGVELAVWWAQLCDAALTRDELGVVRAGRRGAAG